MTHAPHLRDACRRLRVEQGLTIDELAERLALPRTTVYSWVRDLPAPPRLANPGQRLGTLAMQAKYQALRDQAYAEGVADWAALSVEPGFRDFVCLYLAEGSKRNRNEVQICNSDPAVMRLADRWIRRLSARPVDYRVQYHVDQDLEAIRLFWAATLGIAPRAIHLQRKSNSGQLRGRSWRSVHGVLSIRVNDTLLRARLQAWIDHVRGDWL